jgi:N6-L-threonylcarbamoyladenine synthase
MIILAVETSCDETGIAVIEVNKKKLAKIKVLTNIVASQAKLHAKYGGVYPFLAKREHVSNLPKILQETFKKAKNPKIDAVAVTIGPGLDPCLWTGVNFVKSLAKEIGVPIIPINHIEAHIYANFLKLKSKAEFKKIFPAIALLVSGGHTQIVLMKKFGDYKVIGETRDDAAGECFDKTARILGLGYPGGPEISKEASKVKKASKKFNLPRPMMYQKNYDFSFSGLKTAVLYDHKKKSLKVRKSKKYIQQMSAEIQQAIIDVLVYKTVKAAGEHIAKTVILGGGVAANKELRKQLQKSIKKELHKVEYMKPELRLATDNALMIAITAYYHILFGKKKSWKKIKADANLRL